MADIEKLIPLPYTTPIVDSNGVLTQQAQSFFETIANRALVIGSGSPDGIVSASKGAEYMDENGAPGAIKWIKKFNEVGGDASLGWVPL